MKFLKFFMLLFIGATFVLTSCDPDPIDEIIEETIEPVDRVENKILQRTSPTDEGLDLECFTILYPFELITINENTVAINSIEDFENAILDTADYIVDFVYPLSISYDDGDTDELESIEEVAEAFASCIPDQGWGEDDFPAFLINDESSCFEFVYPVELENLDGETFVVQDEIEFLDVMTTEDFLLFSFPLTLTSDDTGEIEVEDSYELFELLASCDNINQPCDSLIWGGELVCYQINFPISFVTIDGNVVSAANLDELNQIILQGDIIDFAYPVELINEDGEVLVANNEEELNELFEECGVFVDDTDLLFLLIGIESECFEVQFPINVELDGEIEQIEDVEGIHESLYYSAELVYPLTILFEGDEVEIESLEDLIEILEDCE